MKMISNKKTENKVIHVLDLIIYKNSKHVLHIKLHAIYF